MCLDWETEAENRTASRAAKGAKYLKCRLRQLLLILEMDMTQIFPLNYSHWCVMRQIKSTFVYFSWLGEWGFNFFYFYFLLENCLWFQQNSDTNALIEYEYLYFFSLIQWGHWKEGYFTFVKSIQAFGCLLYSAEVVMLSCVLTNLTNPPPPACKAQPFHSHPVA